MSKVKVVHDVKEIVSQEIRLDDGSEGSWSSNRKTKRGQSTITKVHRSTNWSKTTNKVVDSNSPTEDDESIIDQNLIEDQWESESNHIKIEEKVRLIDRN